MSTPRAGFSLIECMTSLALGALLLGMVGSTLVVHDRLARAQAEHIARADALRTPAELLRAETRALEPEIDLRAVARDSIAIRAFRGLARVCSAAADTLIVAYQGLRDPDPTKDSVLLIGAGPPTAAALRSVQRAPDSTSCRLIETSRVLRLQLAGPDHAAPVTNPALALLFESGMYFLSSNALRYRRGAEGRQPITPEWLDPGSNFQLVFASDTLPPTGIIADLRGLRARVASALGPTAVTPTNVRVRSSFPNSFGRTDSRSESNP